MEWNPVPIDSRQLIWPVLHSLQPKPANQTELPFLAPAKSPRFGAHCKRTVQIARFGAAPASSGPNPGQVRPVSSLLASAAPAARVADPSSPDLVTHSPESNLLEPSFRPRSGAALPASVPSPPPHPLSVRITSPRSTSAARGNHGAGLPQALRRLLRQQGDAGMLSVSPITFALGETRAPRLLESIRSRSVDKVRR
jgi:hypothetical protein